MLLACYSRIDGMNIMLLRDEGTKPAEPTRRHVKEASLYRIRNQCLIITSYKQAKIIQLNIITITPKTPHQCLVPSISQSS